MKRCSTLVLLAVLLTLACLSPAAAVLPKPDGYTTVNLAQGWFDNQLVWYFGSTTNNIRFAQTGGLTLAPKLFSAIADGAAPAVYIVKNFQQGPVFSGSPSDPTTTYTGLWQVYYITWTTGTPRPITNSDPYDVALNPYGRPTVGATTVAQSIVVDYPILIAGTLGIAAPTFRIPQLISFNAKAKTAVLPYFKAFCQNYVTKKASIVNALITEASDPNVAVLIGANNALLLETALGIPDTQEAWLFNPPGFPPPSPPSPPSQLPIIEWCPTALSYRNGNFFYSPVMRSTLLIRNGASPTSIINNPTTVKMLIANTKLTTLGLVALNVHVIALDVK
jgi:hypothetical protein